MCQVLVGFHTSNGLYLDTGEEMIKFDVACDLVDLFGGPSGFRTRVTDVRGRCPRPLDDGTPSTKQS